MKIQIATLVLTTLGLTACNTPNTQVTEPVVNTENSEPIVSTENSKSISNTDNSKNSLDWVGYYFNPVPCTTCGDIITSIMLNENGTYEIHQEHKDQAQEAAVHNGTIEWSADGSIIVLNKQKYQVGENRLELLDDNGNQIDKSHVLVKSELEQSPDINDGHYLYLYKDESGQSYNVVFNTTETPPKVLIESTHKTADENKIMYELPQVEAWAKGAVYANEDESVTLTSQRDTAILSISGKERKLKRVQ